MQTITPIYLNAGYARILDPDRLCTNKLTQASRITFLYEKCKEDDFDTEI
jgi:hypothetical protein